MPVLFEYKDDDVIVHHTLDGNPDAGSHIMHAHEMCEILWFIRGKGVYMIEGTRYPLENGCILIMRPAETHKLYIDEGYPYERVAVHFSPASLNAADPSGLLTEAYFNRKLGVQNLYMQHEFTSPFSSLLMENMCLPGKSPEESKLNIMINLYQVLNQIAVAFRNRNEGKSFLQNKDMAISMIEYINMNLYGDLSLDTLSKLFFISKSQLERLFTKATGTSISKYISIKRLMEARRRLRLGEKATSVYKSCGFGDYSSFYRAYKNKFDISPSTDIL